MRCEADGICLLALYLALIQHEDAGLRVAHVMSRATLCRSSPMRDALYLSDRVRLAAAVVVVAAT
jgi:hypothetical protein